MKTLNAPSVLTVVERRASMRRASELLLWQRSIKEEPMVQQIEDGARAFRLPLYRVNCPVGGKTRPNAAGIPDLMGWIPGAWMPSGQPLPLYVEVKRPIGGSKTVEQQLFIDRALRDGCLAFFARGWDDVVLELQKVGVHLCDP